MASSHLTQLFPSAGTRFHPSSASAGFLSGQHPGMSSSPFAAQAEDGPGMLPFSTSLRSLPRLPESFALPEPVPFELIGAFESSASCPTQQHFQQAALPWESAEVQALFLDSCDMADDPPSTRSVAVSCSERPSTSTPTNAVAPLPCGSPSPKTEPSTELKSSAIPQQPGDRLETMRKTNREAQKRWRQRNKGRVKLQQQQIDAQQKELKAAKGEAERAKQDLHKALQALQKQQSRQQSKTPESWEHSSSMPPPERPLTTFGDQLRVKIDQLDALRSTALTSGPQDAFNMAEDISTMLHNMGNSRSAILLDTQADGKSLMQTVWPSGGPPCYWQWGDLIKQFSDMWSGQPYESGSATLTISGESQQIAISSIVNAPLEKFMAIKERYNKSMAVLLNAAGNIADSPAGLRAQQLSREAVQLTFWAVYQSPQRTLSAYAFDYATRKSQALEDPLVWQRVMEASAPTPEQYEGMRRLHRAYYARLERLQHTRIKLSARIGALASAKHIPHAEYASIFAAIQALHHTMALEQKMLHEVVMLICSNFTAYQVALAFVTAYPRFLDPRAILDSYVTYQPSSLRKSFTEDGAPLRNSFTEERPSLCTSLAEDGPPLP